MVGMDYGFPPARLFFCYLFVVVSAFEDSLFCWFD